jgi:hypothetical protein
MKGHERYAAELDALPPGEVCVVGDVDDAGRDGAEKRAEWWLQRGVPVRVVELPEGLGHKGDLRDFLNGKSAREGQQAVEPLGDAAALDALADATELRAPNSVYCVEAFQDPVEFGADEYGPEVAVDAFPEPLRRYIETLADSYQVAPDLVAGAVLGMAAAAAAGRAEVAVGETHTEPLNLYVMPVAPPGERKSVIRETTFPLEDEERRLAEAARSEICEAQIQRDIAEKRMKHLEDRAAKSEDASEREEARREASALGLGLPSVPPEPQLLLDDATPEYVARALDEQGGCVAIVSEEAGTLFEVMCGKYRDGVADLDIYLKAYDGGAIRVGRISREQVVVEHPALTILVTPQPAVLDRLAERSELRGRGILGRIAFILPPSRVGTRMYRNQGIDAAAKAAYGDALQRILRLPRSQEGPPRRLVLEGEALDLWAVTRIDWNASRRRMVGLPAFETGRRSMRAVSRGSRGSSTSSTKRAGPTPSPSPSAR